MYEISRIKAVCFCKTILIRTRSISQYANSVCALSTIPGLPAFLMSQVAVLMNYGYALQPMTYHIWCNCIDPVSTGSVSATSSNCRRHSISLDDAELFLVYLLQLPQTLIYCSYFKSKTVLHKMQKTSHPSIP